MNYFLSWCRPLLVAFLFHAMTSQLPTSFHRNDFSTCLPLNAESNEAMTSLHDFSTCRCVEFLSVSTVSLHCTYSQIHNLLLLFIDVKVPASCGTVGLIY